MEVERAAEALQVSLQLYNPSTWSTRRYTHSLQRLYSSTVLYSPLQPSTALQLYVLYIMQPSTAPLMSQVMLCLHSCKIPG